jgi:hypothetical protein
MIRAHHLSLVCRQCIISLPKKFEWITQNLLEETLIHGFIVRIDVERNMEILQFYDWNYSIIFIASRVNTRLKTLSFVQLYMCFILISDHTPLFYHHI